MKNVLFIFLVWLLLPFTRGHAQGFLWATTNYGSPDAQLSSQGCTVDKKGNAYVFGEVYQSGTAPLDSIRVAFGTDTAYDHGNIAGCAVVFSTDSNGAYRWAYSWSGVYVDIISVMATDGADNLYILGNTDVDSLNSPGFNIPPLTCFLMKMSNSGHVSGVKTFGFVNLSMVISASNNIYITGDYRDSVNLGSTVFRGDGSNANRMFIAKLDTSLNTIWAFNVGGDSTSGNAVAVANDSIIYVAGAFEKYVDTIGTLRLTNTHTWPDLSWNYFIAKYDSSGHSQWVQNVSVFDSFLNIFSIATDKNNNVYCSGGHRNAIYIGADTLQVPVIGAYGSDGAGYLIKYSNNGHSIWGRSVNSDYGITSTINIDRCNNIWTTNVNSLGFGMDHFGILSFDTSGDRLDTLTVTGRGAINTDLNGDLYIVGSYDTCYTPSRTLFVNNYTSTYQITVGKYKYGNADCSRDTIQVYPANVATTLSKTYNIELQPNPASSTCTIAGDPAFLEHSTAQLYDMSGRLVKSCTLSVGNATIGIDDVRPGVYLVKVTSILGESVILRVVVLR